MPSQLVCLGMILVAVGSYSFAYATGVNDASYRALTQSPVEVCVKVAIAMLLAIVGVVLLVNREQHSRDITKRAAMKTFFGALKVAIAVHLVGHIVGVQQGLAWAELHRPHSTFVPYTLAIGFCGVILLLIRERRTFLI